MKTLNLRVFLPEPKNGSDTARVYERTQFFTQSQKSFLSDDCRWTNFARGIKQHGQCACANLSQRNGFCVFVLEPRYARQQPHHLRIAATHQLVHLKLQVDVPDDVVSKIGNV